MEDKKTRHLQLVRDDEPRFALREVGTMLPPGLPRTVLVGEGPLPEVVTRLVEINGKLVLAWDTIRRQRHVIAAAEELRAALVALNTAWEIPKDNPDRVPSMAAAADHVNAALAAYDLVHERMGT